MGNRNREKGCNEIERLYGEIVIEMVSGNGVSHEAKPVMFCGWFEYEKNRSE